MTDKSVLTAYATRLGDNALILGQRMIELVAGSPELEEELANANFALDYIGQARMFYTMRVSVKAQGAAKTTLLFCGRSMNTGTCCWSSNPTDILVTLSCARCCSSPGTWRCSKY